MVAASCCTELAWLMEPSLRLWAPEETWPLAEETCSAEALICCMVPLSWTLRVRMEERMLWKSPT